MVTSNHDMMTLCDELGQQFVWIDPRGRQLERPDQVLLVFSQISEWARILAAVVGDRSPPRSRRRSRLRWATISDVRVAGETVVPCR